jgi:hypothetical protein
LATIGTYVSRGSIPGASTQTVEFISLIISPWRRVPRAARQLGSMRCLSPQDRRQLTSVAGRLGRYAEPHERRQAPRTVARSPC